MEKSDKRGGRPRNQLRPVSITPGFHSMAEGSVLYRSGRTLVLCTASIDEKVPDWMRDKGKGWVTAEYQMHPRSNPVRRERRDGRERPLGGRTREIERLIGRSLRAAVNLEVLGERQLVVDCDVLEADGGTRTASITGGFVALALALAKLQKKTGEARPYLYSQVAAVSAGVVDEEASLDLCYAEDSTARVDLNLVATAQSEVIEIQGTAEGRPVARAQMDSLVDLAMSGVLELTRLQSLALAEVGVDLAQLVGDPE